MRLLKTISLCAYVVLFIPLYVSAYQCDILTTFSEAIYCGDAITLNVEVENADESCLDESIQCLWSSPDGPLYGNSINITEPGMYTASYSDCSGCAAVKQINVVEEALDGGNLISGVSLQICTGDGVDDIIPSGSLAIQNPTGPNTQLLIIDFEGQILFMPSTIADINWDILGNGQLLIVHLAYGDDLEGLEVGANIWNDLEGCNSKSNPLYVNLNDCTGQNQALPDVIPLSVSQTSITVYWEDDLAAPSQVVFEYKEENSLDWTTFQPTDNFVIVNNLNTCSSYSFRLRSGDAVEDYIYSNISLVETTGCPVCPTVDNLFSFNVSSTSAFLTWDLVIDASYIFRYRPLATQDWIIYETTYPAIVLFGLGDCTDYEWFTEVNCNGIDDNSSTSLQLVQTECKEADALLSATYNIYPNPSSGLIQISSKDEIEFAEVSDYEGKIHFSQFTPEESIESLDLSHLMTGRYLIKLTGKNSTEVLPFVIQ